MNKEIIITYETREDDPDAFGVYVDFDGLDNIQVLGILELAKHMILNSGGTLFDDDITKLLE